MSARYFYEYTTDAQYADITAAVRLPGSTDVQPLDVTQNAEEGSVALSRITIDDPLGIYDIVGWRRMYVTEDTATGSNTVIYNGYIADRTVERGPYRNGVGRVWRVALADSNAVGQWRVMVGTDANRPAETDVARMQWLMGTNEMNRIPNTTYLSTADPVAMAAVDYRGQRASDIMDDCAQQSGKNYWVRYIETGDTLGIWYDFAAISLYDSVVRLTNVLSEVDNLTTFAITEGTSLNRDPSRVYSGALVQYDGGTVYEESTSTSNRFTRRDAIVPAQNVKTAGSATSRAIRYLADMSSEEDVVTAGFEVPAARVNFLREGMTCQFKATHLPGYESYNVLRVLNRKVLQISEERYLVTVDLTGGPLPEAEPPPPPAEGGHAWEGSIAVPDSLSQFAGYWSSTGYQFAANTTYNYQVVLSNGAGTYSLKANLQAGVDYPGLASAWKTFGADNGAGLPGSSATYTGSFTTPNDGSGDFDDDTLTYMRGRCAGAHDGVYYATVSFWFDPA